MDAFRPDYPHFDAYEADVLQEKSTLEQLLTMDSELANYIHLSKYIGPLHPADLPILRREYSTRFEQFLHDRLDGVVADPAERTAPYEDQFGDFRKAIAELNQNLPGAADSPVTTLPRPAERLLTKSLRRQGFDPSQMELDHMQRDGTLYLLELFATAAQQEAADDDSLLSELANSLSHQIEDYYEDSEDLFGPVREHTLGTWMKAKQDDVELHIAEFLTLGSMIGIIKGHDPLMDKCGFEDNDEVDELGGVKDLRDRVMHGNRTLVNNKEMLKKHLDRIERAENIVQRLPDPESR